jgi:cytochrome c
MTAYRRIAVVTAILLAGVSAEAQAAGDAAKGEKVFKKCAACHSLEPGKKKVGPSLHGVIGRTAGSAEGYRYSKAMTAHGQSGVVWNADTLEQFLGAPRQAVKGTKMGFPGLKKAQDRADVIAFLGQHSSP